MNVLIFRNYNQTVNNHIAELQLLIGLKSKGVDITYIGNGKEENLKLLQKNNITVIENFFTGSFNLSFIKKLREFILKNEFEIMHLFIAKQLRYSIPSTLNLPIKIVAYFGSSSLHWHDPSAYLTFLSPRVNKIICNSEYVFQHVKKQLIKKNKAVKIYKGYDKNWFNDVIAFDYTTLGIPKNDLIICTVARNTKVKGIKYFIEASKELSDYKNVHFIIIGGKTNTAKVHKSIKNFSNHKNIHLLGYRKDVISLIKGADIYTQTSLSEGLGRAISEAMCLRKPIVMTDAGGCTELIEDGKSGIIVPIKSPIAIAKAWKELVKSSELRLNMGKAAQQAIKDNFNIQTTIEETYQLYKKLLK